MSAGRSKDYFYLDFVRGRNKRFEVLSTLQDLEAFDIQTSR